MPGASRAISRAARKRKNDKGITYTQALEDVRLILGLMPELDCNFEMAENYYDDPANRIMCETCGWTYAMVCPECSPGCGCNNGRCSGWRHEEYMHEDDLRDLDGDGGCPECGAGAGPYDESCDCVPEGAAAVNVEPEPEPDWKDYRRDEPEPDWDSYYAESREEPLPDEPIGDDDAEPEGDADFPPF
jgi:hypothetical protein